MYHYQVVARMSSKQPREITVKALTALEDHEISREILERIHVSFRYLVRIEDIREIEKPERVDVYIDC